VAELRTVAPGSNAYVANATALRGVEVAQDVDTTSHTTSTTVDGLVAEGVGQTLHGVSRGDRIAAEVQLTMYLHKRHGASVAREHRKATRAQVATPEGMRVRCLRRDWRWPAAMRHTKASNDVLRFDTWPHDDAELGELRTDIGELARERALGVVELGRLAEECGALGVKDGELPRTVRDSAVALWIFGGEHARSPHERPLGGSKPLRMWRAGCRLPTL
jgi:hypothetical protein